MYTGSSPTYIKHVIT